MTETPNPHQNDIDEAAELEHLAQDFFKKKQIEEAFSAYQEAGLIYRKYEDHIKAAHCFAAAAGCEKIRTGKESVLEAAVLNDYAAREALKAGRYDYAQWLFREAGLLFENEGDFERYSDAFIHAQNAHMRHLLFMIFHGRRQDKNKADKPMPMVRRFSAVLEYGLGLLSRFLWGYGEKPFRPFLTACILILVCAVAYWTSGLVAAAGVVRNIHFSEALYLSGVTFTTLGYGDYVPLGWTRILSVVESYAGLFMTPLFIVALTRRYLRAYR
ncbi:MAG: two pore domain potassium channel family protein [Candidatus Omnitrophica bacterium]|nr:two pore domain potassium channel family protein [Candidatus Omnitrophota bacterium]